MAESSFQASEGTGKFLHTNTQVIGGVTVHDEFMVLGETLYPTYSVNSNASGATNLDHMIQLMAGSSLKVRIRQITIDLAAATANGALQLGFVRLSSAGTGGAALTISALDGGDGAAGATAMAAPTSKGTEVAGVWARPTFITAAAAPQPAGQRYIWTPNPRSKGIVIPIGTANGFAVKVMSNVAGSVCNIWVEFDETAF